MYRRTISTGVALVPDSLRFIESRNSVYAAASDGRLVAVRLFDGRLVDLGAGYTGPVGVVSLTDGVRLAVAESSGAILVVARDTADRQHARLLAQLPAPVLGLDEHPNSGSLLVLSDASPDGQLLPRLLQCDLQTGDISVVAADLDGARSLVVDTDRRSVLVLSVLADGSRTLTTIGLDDGAVDTVTTEAYDHFTSAPAAGALAVFATRSDPAAPGNDTLTYWQGAEAAVEPIPGRVDGLARWESLVLIASGADLHAVEWDIDDGQVPITVPLGPLAVTGYARLLVDLPAAGLAIGDVTYTVREGVGAGAISLGVEPPNPDGTESVMLLAGFLAGEFHVEAISVADGSTLAVRRFRVTTLWPDDVSGPPIAITGDVGATLMNWGGTGGVAGYRFPTPREWRVVVVLLFLKDRDYGDTESATRDEWKQRVIGDGESLRHYYEEVSAFVANTHGMTVKLVGDQVFGPISVNRGWGDVFKKRGGVNDGWQSTPEGKIELAGAVSTFFADMPGGAAQISLADSFVFVVRSGSDDPIPMGAGNPDLPTKYVWGHANPTVDFWRKVTNPDTSFTFTQFQRPVTFVTDAFPAAAPNTNVTRTLCHEVGHNLGLDDLYDAHGDYPAEVNERAVGAVDLMGSSQKLPHFSVANRIALGWIDRNWLRRFDFTANPAGGNVVLQAVETIDAGGPTGGRAAGIEVPISDDWSYLFEYRREQSGQIGDQELDPAVDPGSTELIAGTDLRFRGGDVARPPILALPNDADGDGPVLDSDGQDYTDSDVTNPERMHDFVLRLDSIRSPDNDSAKVVVEYLEAHRPQLLVHPAPGNGNFKSPDINLVGPLGLAMPVVVKGATNIIKITVHNVGSLDATQTQIHVKWLPWTLTPGDWRDLDDPPVFNVPARGRTTLQVPWPLPASVPVGDDHVEAQHFCVRVDIDRYRDPAHPDADEIVVFDNWAQSNFDTKAVGFGSPSDRLSTAATATNTLARNATYLFDVHQDTPWYRIYLGHAWLELAPGETRATPVAYESLAGDPVHGESFQRNLEWILSHEHHLVVVSSLLPEDTACGTPRRVFGCGLTLRTGRRVLIDQAGHDEEVVFARVAALRDGAWEPVPSGQFNLAAWPDDDPAHVAVSHGNISNGRGSTLIPRITLQDLRNGRPTSFTLGRPGDNTYITAVTTPQSLL